MKKYIIVTEANYDVASGHLYECIALSKKMNTLKLPVILAVNKSMPSKWLGLLDDINYIFYDNVLEIAEQLYHTKNARNDEFYIITNLRDVNNRVVKDLRWNEHTTVVCLDEWGNKNIECDIVINNMASDSFWKYSGALQCYCGAKYLILSEKLKDYATKNKVIRRNIDNVVISMGGVDKFNHTKDVLSVIGDNNDIKRIDVVLGGGYRYEDTLTTLCAKDSRVYLHRNIDYIYDLFYEADVAFSAGGNTMYELAAIGTPSIILPTMEHEEKNAIAFLDHGVFDVVKDVNSITLPDYYQRKKSSFQGKEYIDGCGIENVMDIICG